MAVALVAQAAGIGAAVPNPDGTRTDVSRDFLAQWADRIADHDSRLIVAGVDPDLHRIMVRSGLIEKLGANNVIPATNIVLESVETAYEEGIRWLAVPRPEP